MQKGDRGGGGGSHIRRNSSLAESITGKLSCSYQNSRARLLSINNLKGMVCLFKSCADPDELICFQSDLPRNTFVVPGLHFF